MQVSGKESDQKQDDMQLTDKQIEFLSSDHVLAERMRYLLAALEGYKVPWMLAEVLLQSNDQERKLWQQLEGIFVFSKKSNNALAKEMAKVLKQLVNQGWFEYRLQTSRTQGLNFARSLEPEVLVEEGQKLQFSANPYDISNKKSFDSATSMDDFDEAVRAKLIEAWRESFHKYLCLIREESW